MQATPTSKGKITIPVALRRQLDLRVGDRLEFDEDPPYLTASKTIAPDVWDKFRGAWRNPYTGQSSRRVLDELRGPADLPAKKFKTRK